MTKTSYSTDDSLPESAIREGTPFEKGRARPASSGQPGLPTPGEVESLYRVMLREMGPTGWWPADSEYEVMVGAVLTQNAAWRNVERSLDALRAAGLLDPRVIARMDGEPLQGLIRPSGFYRNKSRALREVSRWYVERCGATPQGAAGIDDGTLRGELLALFGVGGETAGWRRAPCADFAPAVRVPYLGIPRSAIVES